MTVAKSIKKKRPRPPSPSYPLWTHPNGQWAKKIRGKVYFFGVWSDPDKALENYRSDKAYLESGTTPKDSDALTVKRAINVFLTRLEAKVEDGARSRRHFEDCKRTSDVIVKSIDRNRLVSDLTGDDFFELRRKFERKKKGGKTSPATVQGHVARTAAIFNYAVAEGHIDRVVYGKDFFGLTERQRATLESTANSKFIEAGDIRTLIESANYRFKAMLLLGINCGMGNTDVASLRFDDLDLSDGWYETDRHKTAVRRCAKLWPETIAALIFALERRFAPKSKADAELVFITRHRRNFGDQTAITNEFNNLKRKIGFEPAKGVGFYTLRHVTKSVADQLSDEGATRWIMGHKRAKVSDHYSHKPPKDRIQKVCDHVRTWLYGVKPE